MDTRDDSTSDKSRRRHVGNKSVRGRSSRLGNVRSSRRVHTLADTRALWTLPPLYHAADCTLYAGAGTVGTTFEVVAEAAVSDVAYAALSPGDRDSLWHCRHRKIRVRGGAVGWTLILPRRCLKTLTLKPWDAALQSRTGSVCSCWRHTP